MDAPPSEEERTAIDAHLGLPEDGWSGGAREGDTHRVARSGRAEREQRHLLIEALHVLQAEIGWISPGGMNYVCRRLSVPPADAFGVASFYAMFATEERPKTVVHVCDDLACRVLGAKELCAELETTIGPEGTESPQGGATWHRSPCLGMCEQAPAILAQRAGRADVALGGATAASVAAVSAPGSTMTCAGADTAPQTWE
ncbi:MAG: NADH-quinone oxidoreductase subunit, partial [Actinomycetota bacterium]|nr:NADH-quinone oxidoreductase subunit [Actinomycetota bacterium]